MAVADFFTMFTTMFAFLPAWFSLAFAGFLGIMCGIILFRVIAFIIDVIPFV